MTPATIPISTIARFSHDGRVFRSFGHLLAARNGSLLAVPFGLATGDFSALVDGCPVPWTEVWAAIDTPRAAHSRALSPEQLASNAPLVAALFSPYGWLQDSISTGHGWGPVPRVSSPDGVIFCWVR
jgi:hypothetical protein